VDVPLPWEQLLWRGRPLRPLRRLAGEQYVLTDFRLVCVARARTRELALGDIGDVQRAESRVDRLLGTSTLTVHARRSSVTPLVLASIRTGAQLAALIELLSGDPRASIDPETVRAALSWDPRAGAGDLRKAVATLAVALLAVFAVAIGLHGTATPVSHAPDDAIAPNGMKRSRAEIIAFMERDVMPWARMTLGRIKGGPDRITCETCHGGDAPTRGWRMPAVAALPLPDVKERGWEIYGGSMDSQMRNAIYGYIAESEKQAKAAYMREVVVPGMARLLHRPAYDFTKTYDYNRAHDAIGCYHCHRVK
jgi:hypothetical protein